jgi:hypothetical protein
MKLCNFKGHYRRISGSSIWSVRHVQVPSVCDMAAGLRLVSRATGSTRVVQQRQKCAPAPAGGPWNVCRLGAVVFWFSGESGHSCLCLLLHVGPTHVAWLPGQLAQAPPVWWAVAAHVGAVFRRCLALVGAVKRLDQPWFVAGPFWAGRPTFCG